MARRRSIAIVLDPTHAAWTKRSSINLLPSLSENPLYLARRLSAASDDEEDVSVEFRDLVKQKRLVPRLEGRLLVNQEHLRRKHQGYVEQPTKAWFTPEERRSARQAVLDILPIANKLEFFEKTATMVRDESDVLNGEQFDRCIVGFGPQGLIHLDSVLQAWAAGDEFRSGKIAIVGDPRGSGTWNEDSLENTLNSPPETAHRQALIESFMQQHRDVLRTFFKSINNTAAEMMLDYTLNEGAGLPNGGNAPTTRGIYAPVVFDPIFGNINENVRKLGAKVVVKFFVAVVTDILIDLPETERGKGEVVVFKFPKPEVDCNGKEIQWALRALDTASCMLLSEKVLMDTGTVSKAVREPLRQREAHLLMDQCGFGRSDLDAVNAQLDARCYSGWMDARLGRKLEELGLLQEDGTLKPAVIEKGRRVGGPVIAVRGKMLSAYETLTALNRYMKVFDYDSESMMLTVDKRRAEMYKGSIICWSRPSRNRDPIHPDLKWSPPRTFGHLPVVDEDSGEVVSNSDPFFWPYANVFPRGDDRSCMAEGISGNGHFHFGNLAEEAKVAIKEAILGRERMPHLESMSHDTKVYATAWKRIVELRREAFSLRERAELEAVETARAAATEKARQLRAESNRLVGSILNTQQAVDRAMAYQSIIWFPPFIGQDHLPLRVSHWGRKNMQASAPPSKSSSTSEPDVIDSTLLTDVSRFSYLPVTAAFSRLSLPRSCTVHGQLASSKHSNFHQNAVESKRQQDAFRNITSAIVPCVLMARILVELGVMIDSESLLIPNVDLDKKTATGWTTTGSDGAPVQVDLVTAMPVFDPECTELHRNMIERSMNRNAAYAGAPARPKVDHYLRRIVNSRGEVTGVEDNSILNTGVEDNARNIVSTLLVDVNNLDSTLFRAEMNRRYHEPMEALAHKLFFERGTVVQKINARLSVAKGMDQSDVNYERNVRRLEAPYILRQVKDLAIIHAKELRDRRLKVAASQIHKQKIWTHFRNCVNLVNQKNGGLNAILMLNTVVRRRKAPKGSGFGSIYGDAGEDYEDEDEVDEDEEDDEADGDETYAQRIYARANNEITNLINNSTKERRASERRASAGAATTTAAATASAACQSRVPKHPNFYFSPPRSFAGFLALQSQPSEDHLHKQLLVFKNLVGLQSTV